MKIGSAIVSARSEIWFALFRRSEMGFYDWHVQSPGCSRSKLHHLRDTRKVGIDRRALLFRFRRLIKISDARDLSGRQLLHSDLFAQETQTVAWHIENSSTAVPIGDAFSPEPKCHSHELRRTSRLVRDQRRWATEPHP